MTHRKEKGDTRPLSMYPTFNEESINFLLDILLDVNERNPSSVVSAN